MDELALLDDAGLLQRVRDGVEEAFRVLWTRYYVSAFNYAKTRVGGRTFDAEEIVTDAYTRIWRSLHDGRGPETNFRAYLYAAIRTVAWDRVLRLEDPLDALDDLAAPQLEEPGREDDVVARCFYALNQRYRTVLWLSAVEGYKPAEVGKALGVDARHASVLIMRSKESFRKLYMGETSDLGDDVTDGELDAKAFPGTSQVGGSGPKATSALGRHLLGGVAGLTAVQAVAAGASWASAATIISPPPMPASVMLAAGAAVLGGAAAASGAGTGAGAGAAGGAASGAATGSTAASGTGSTSASGSSAASSSGAASGGASGGASGVASTAAATAGSGATGVAMAAVGVAVVAVIGAAALGISGVFGSSGPSNPPPAVTQTTSTPTQSSPSVETPTPTDSPTPTPAPTATPSTTRPPTSQTSTVVPVQPAQPATQAPAETEPPATTQTPDAQPTPDSPTGPWATDPSQCVGSDQWYSPSPGGPFTRCPTS